MACYLRSTTVQEVGTVRSVVTLPLRYATVRIGGFFKAANTDSFVLGGRQKGYQTTLWIKTSIVGEVVDTASDILSMTFIFASVTAPTSFQYLSQKTK